ncbi:MAG: hypothetical protein IPK24_05440 [Kineosporiaceae bacterium]|nr:hypothetical protein [Kineosporiaceae bacterium]MBK8075014.1 hypothetical protein [Kineosporiaceae bacterium]
MSGELYSQLIGAAAGTLLLSAVMVVWRRSLSVDLRLLAVQGVALGVLVAVMALHEGDPLLLLVALMVLVLKAVVLPVALARGMAATQADHERAPLLNPTASLLACVGLAGLAYVVSAPLASSGDDPALRAVPIGVTLVLIGLLTLTTRRRAMSQLIGFVMMDNGIATVALLTAGGVPLVVELGVSLDVLLVVLILLVLTSRMQAAFGGTDLDELKELHD